MWRTHRDNKINSTPTNNYITIFIQTLTLYFSDSFRRFRKLPKRVYSEFMSDCMGYLPVYGVGPSYPTPITATTRHFYALKTYCAIFPQKRRVDVMVSPVYSIQSSRRYCTMQKNNREKPPKFVFLCINIERQVFRA
jgi:hypothetical protein